MDDLDALEADRLINLTSGGLVTQVISVAAALGVADALVGAPGTSAEVAERCGADPTSVRRLLSALAALGIVEALDADLRASPSTPPGERAHWSSPIGSAPDGSPRATGITTAARGAGWWARCATSSTPAEPSWAPIPPKSMRWARAATRRRWPTGSS